METSALASSLAGDATAAPVPLDDDLLVSPSHQLSSFALSLTEQASAEEDAADIDFAAALASPEAVRALLAQTDADTHALAAAYADLMTSLATASDQARHTTLQCMHSLQASVTTVCGSALQAADGARAFAAQCASLHQLASRLTPLEQQVQQLRRTLTALEPLAVQAARRQPAVPKSMPPR